MTPRLANYVAALTQNDLSPLAELAPNTLYDYVFTAEGVHLHARREGLTAMVPIAFCDIRGLVKVDPGVVFTLPRVPWKYLAAMLRLARQACIDNGSPIEILFHLVWSGEEQKWELHQPPQEQSHSACRPLEDDAESSYGRAIIEVHSHHQMSAEFSGTDDADEQGFRIYGVIGEIFSHPKVNLRVGVYGHFMELPADQIFEINRDEITDQNEYLHDPGTTVEEVVEKAYPEATLFNVSEEFNTEV